LRKRAVRLYVCVCINVSAFLMYVIFRQIFHQFCFEELFVKDSRKNLIVTERKLEEICLSHFIIVSSTFSLLKMQILQATESCFVDNQSNNGDDG